MSTSLKLNARTAFHLIKKPQPDDENYQNDKDIAGDQNPRSMVIGRYRLERRNQDGIVVRHEADVRVEPLVKRMIRFGSL